MIFDSLDNAQKERMLQHLELVIEKNKTVNLTRIDTLDSGILLHIEDSLSCLQEFELDDGLFLDIGTGGGFPGIPLAIASGRKGLLIDSIGKKILAVQDFIDVLGLDDQLQARCIRSEDLAREQGSIFTTVITRAVASLPVILELSSPLLITGGHCIALKGNEDQNSVSEAQLIAKRVGMELVHVRNFSLNNEYSRCVLLFQKVSEPQIRLPRRPGMANKKPLSTNSTNSF